MITFQKVKKCSAILTLSFLLLSQPGVSELTLIQSTKAQDSGGMTTTVTLDPTMAPSSSSEGEVPLPALEPEAEVPQEQEPVVAEEPAPPIQEPIVNPPEPESPQEPDQTIPPEETFIPPPPSEDPVPQIPPTPAPEDPVTVLAPSPFFQEAPYATMQAPVPQTAQQYCADGSTMTAPEFDYAKNTGAVTVTFNEQGGQETAQIINTTGCSAPLVLASYKVFIQPGYPGWLDTQEFFAATPLTHINPNGTTVMSVSIPSCRSQVDIWYQFAPAHLSDSEDYGNPFHLPYVSHATMTSGSLCLEADLSITKATSQTSVQEGGILTYTLTAHNDGPRTATNVVIADEIRSGLTFYPQGSDVRCLQNGANVLCDNFSLADDQSLSFLVAFTVNAQPGGCTPRTVSNDATISASSTDPDPTDNRSAMVTTPVTCPTEEADLSITKATSQQSVQPGGTLSYTVTVTNNGPDTATSIVITDDIPSPLTFNATGSDPLCHMSGTTQVVCDNFSLADDQSRSFTIAFTVPASATCNASVQNTARVSSSASDPVGSNNTVQTTPIPIRCITPTFTITKTDNRTTALPGETLTYQITVTNTSTATATTVVITDVLPSVLTDITASDNGTRNGSTVTWTLSSLAAGASRTLLVVAVIPASTMNGTVLTNIAIVGSVTAQDQTTVGSNGVCDLGITLTDSRDPVEVDDTFTYTVQVRNNSSQTTSNVMLTLSLDSDVEFVSASNGGYNDSNSAVRWNNLSLPSGTSTFTATVRVKDDREGALIHSTAFACNGQDYEDTRVEGEPIPPPPPPPPFVNGRVTIDKRADRSEAHPGSIVSYTITIRNGSNVPTGPIMIEDTFSPRDMTVEDAAGGMTNGSGIEWDLGTIGGYVTRIITYRVRFSSALSQGQTVSNTVRILNSQAGDTENVRVIRQYPQTGLLSSFTSNSMDKEQFLRPVSPKRRDDMDAASLPTVIWITIMAAGTAAGGLIGKKLFLVPI